MTWTPIIVALIIACVPSLIALAAKRSSERNAVKIQEIKVSLDGRLEELLDLTRNAFFAKGVKAEAERSAEPLSGLPAPEPRAIPPEKHPCSP